MNLAVLLQQTDGIGKFVALLLLLMSIASWVVIFWKAWVVKRAVSDVGKSISAFWQGADVSASRSAVQALDREQLVLPLIDASQANAAGTLAGAGDKSQQLTRVLRDALHRVLLKLQFGQAGQVTIDKIAGPVGEALIMTAAGLAVAIPAVLAYNLFGRYINRIEADLEGFARDLRELLANH
jgi:biopolymer transport protein ExbB